MSREEAMNALIESGMELRRDDIELGKKLERERILELIERELGFEGSRQRLVHHESGFPIDNQQLIAMIQGKENYWMTANTESKPKK